jgi:peptide/nickel transport system permease protein
MVILVGIFAPFFSPYSEIRTDRDRQYYPPQSLHFFDEEGNFQIRPFVYGMAEDMDPDTYEFTFTPDVEQKFEIEFFVEGEKWKFLGMQFTTKLFGVDLVTGEYMYLWGTDNLGRDVFSRTLIGTRITLLMAFVVVFLAALIGVIVGVSSGYFAGTLDLITQRVVEFVVAFPDLPLYLALLALLPRRADPAIVFIMFSGILVLIRWASFSREIRGMVISIRSLDYVRSAEALGASSSRILFRHIVPNTTSQIIVWITFQLPDVILLESFLSFLGVGVQPPMVSWGRMLNQILDFQSFNAAPWMMAPVGMIVLTVMAFNAMGDAIRDAVDPYSD